MREIISRCDHTLLRQDAVWEEIRQVCDDGMEFHCASVCIPPSYVERAAAYVAGRVKICTVIGFPSGYSTTYVKCFEAQDALNNGADEIDMVINLGWAKSAHWDWISEEIKAVKTMCGDHVLKVIIETCLLTQEEKIKLCEVVSDSGADYIKTSTGFAGGGATFEDVELMKKYVRPGVKIKASGGIADLADAEKFLALGADRLGTSRIVKAVQAMEQAEK